MSHGTHTNESWHTYKWVMAHIRMSHGTHINESWHTYEWVLMIHPMGWLRLVGSIKLPVSFPEYSLFYRALLQKRPIILSILLTEATPYENPCTPGTKLKVFRNKDCVPRYLQSAVPYLVGIGIILKYLVICVYNQKVSGNGAAATVSIYIYIVTYTCTHMHTHTHLYSYICLYDIYVGNDRLWWYLCMYILNYTMYICV